jgi:hypothetical protein
VAVIRWRVLLLFHHVNIGGFLFFFFHWNVGKGHRSITPVYFFATENQKATNSKSWLVKRMPLQILIGQALRVKRGELGEEFESDTSRSPFTPIKRALISATVGCFRTKRPRKNYNES